MSSLFTGTVFKFHKQLHTINNRERGLLLLVSSQCGASQSVALLASAPCAKYSNFTVATHFVYHWIVPFLHPFPPLDQCDRCLVLLLWGLLAGRRGFSTRQGGRTLEARICNDLPEGKN